MRLMCVPITQPINISVAAGHIIGGDKSKTYLSFTHSHANATQRDHIFSHDFVQPTHVCLFLAHAILYLEPTIPAIFAPNR